VRGPEPSFCLTQKPCKTPDRPNRFAAAAAQEVEDVAVSERRGRRRGASTAAYLTRRHPFWPTGTHGVVELPAAEGLITLIGFCLASSWGQP
jgi:hypothetical protein